MSIHKVALGDYNLTNCKQTSCNPVLCMRKVSETTSVQNKRVGLKRKLNQNDSPQPPLKKSNVFSQPEQEQLQPCSPPDWICL